MKPKQMPVRGDRNETRYDDWAALRPGRWIHARRVGHSHVFANMSENDWRFQNCATGSIRRQAQSLEADIEYLPHPRRWPLHGSTGSGQFRLKWLPFSPALTPEEGTWPTTGIGWPLLPPRKSLDSVTSTPPPAFITNNPSDDSGRSPHTPQQSARFSAGSSTDADHQKPGFRRQNRRR